MAQDRKVFVGGVPQDLNQDDLYAIFSEYAGVKKAWLQKCRASDDGIGATNPPQNHRGFGFVIFHDPNAIEELLCGSASRFIVLRNGAKLEVKRALSSSKMSGVGNRSDIPQDPQRQAPADMAPQQARPWVSQDGNVLSRLSLMPNSVPTYPNADVRVPSQQSLPQPGLLCPPGPVLPPMHSIAPRQNAYSNSKGALRNTVIQFYKEHRPDKLLEQNFVDSICSYYKDKEEQLDEALRTKYGVGLPAPYYQGTQQDQRTLVSGALVGATTHLNPTHAGNIVAAVGGSHPSVTAAKAQTSEPMYAGHLLGLESSWHLGGGPPEAAPPATGASAQTQYQLQTRTGTEHIAGNVNSNATSGLRAPGLFTVQELEAVELPAATPSTRPAPRGNAGSTAQVYPESLTSSYGGSLLSTNGRGTLTTDVDVQLVADMHHGGGQGQGDEGFEISVEVAEAIVGKGGFGSLVDSAI